MITSFINEFRLTLLIATAVRFTYFSLIGFVSGKHASFIGSMEWKLHVPVTCEVNHTKIQFQFKCFSLQIKYQKIFWNFIFSFPKILTKAQLISLSVIPSIVVSLNVMKSTVNFQLLLRLNNLCCKSFCLSHSPALFTYNKNLHDEPTSFFWHKNQ